VLHDDRRIARNVRRHVSREQPRVEVIARADRHADHDAQRLAAVERGQVLLRGGGRRLRQQACRQRGGSKARFHFCPPVPRYLLVARLATGTHLSISLCTNAVSSAGLIIFVSTASCANCFFTCGSSKLAAITRLTFSAISAGRPAGADSAHHVVATRSA